MKNSETQSKTPEFTYRSKDGCLCETERDAIEQNVYLATYDLRNFLSQDKDPRNQECAAVILENKSDVLEFMADLSAALAGKGVNKYKLTK